MPPAPATSATARSARIWAALGIVYVVWGSTYFAIRVAIQTLPPFLMAATRFLVAGGILFGLTAPRGDRRRDRLGPAQWRATAIVGGTLLLGGNGGVVCGSPPWLGLPRRGGDGADGGGRHHH